MMMFSFVELNSIQKVPIKEGNHPPPTSRHRPAASHQPTAINRSRQLSSHLQQLIFLYSEFLYK